MVATAMRTYTVSYERDEGGWWVATVVELRGCRTQGRTIAQARSRIREALGLFVDDSERAALVERVKLAPRHAAPWPATKRPGSERRRSSSMLRPPPGTPFGSSPRSFG